MAPWIGKASPAATTAARTMSRTRMPFDVVRDFIPVTQLVAPRIIGIPVAPDLSEASTACVVDALVHGLQHAS